MPLNVLGEAVGGGVAAPEAPTALATDTMAEIPVAAAAPAPAWTPTLAEGGASVLVEGPATASGVFERGGKERREWWAERWTAAAVAEEGEEEEVEEDLEREGR